MSEDTVFPLLKEQKLQAEIAQLGLENQKLTVDIAKSELEQRALARRAREWESSADEAQTYTFWGEVNRSTVRECMADLATWHRRAPASEIEIIFNSPGGSVIDGLALYDYILELRNSGHNVSTVTLGMAASMGGILLQAGNTRVAGKNAHLLIHEVSTLGIGKLSEIEDEVEFCRKLQDKLLDILSERSTMSKTQIKKKWTRKDWWVDAQSALDLGFVDAIR